MLANPLGTEGPVEIGMMYAHTCNIECRHCGILSSPRNRDRMSLEFAERCIREAAELDPKPTTIAFTGGEPFLFLPELERLIEVCNEVGLPTRVVTNGFWGLNPSSGRKILHRLRLAGLDALNFSADKYHLEFLPALVLRQAIAIAREVGYVAIVNFVVNEPGDPAEQFAHLYAIPREDIRPFREDELAAQIRDDAVPEEAYTKINLSYGRLIGLGRCAEYPEEHRLSPLHEFSYRSCGEVVNRPVVYPNGGLQACCGAGGKIAEFRVGSLHTHSLCELVDRMRQRSHFRFINHLGPRKLFEVMQMARPDGAAQDLHASICDICVAATRGLEAGEVDGLLDHWALGRLFEGALSTERKRGTPGSELIWPAGCGA